MLGMTPGKRDPPPPLWGTGLCHIMYWGLQLSHGSLSTPPDWEICLSACFNSVTDAFALLLPLIRGLSCCKPLLSKLKTLQLAWN